MSSPSGTAATWKRPFLACSGPTHKDRTGALETGRVSWSDLSCSAEDRQTLGCLAAEFLASRTRPFSIDTAGLPWTSSVMEVLHLEGSDIYLVRTWAPTSEEVQASRLLSNAALTNGQASRALCQDALLARRTATAG